VTKKQLIALSLVPHESLARPISSVSTPDATQALAYGAHSRREFSQFMPHHVLNDIDFIVHLAVVHQEPQADKIGQNGGGARLGPDRRDRLARNTANRKARWPTSQSVLQLQPKLQELDKCLTARGLALTI